MSRIKTKTTWQRHLPQKPRRVYRGYYQAQKKKSNKKIIRIIWLIVFVFLLQSIWQAPFLRIDNINIHNNKDITTQEVKESIQNELTATRWLIFKNNNYFLFDSRPMYDILMVEYNLDDVIITKKFPNIIDITVQEKVSHFIWQKDDTLYLLDTDGALNRQIRDLDDKYLILRDLRTSVPNGDAKFSPDEISSIHQIYLKWFELVGAKAKLVQIDIDDDWHLLELRTEVGYYVKLDATEDITEQLDNLNKILFAGNITGVDIDYIDIRFGDKVFFK